MLVTHGGKAKEFDWSYENEWVKIRNVEGKRHEYSLEEFNRILQLLHDRFGRGWFPLENNVEKLYNGTEIPGLGQAIYTLSPEKDTTNAQGASYLGVVLKDAGLLAWNKKHYGIMWRIIIDTVEKDTLRKKFSERSGARRHPDLGGTGTFRIFRSSET
ncbi:MAG: hypothetical protein RRA35_14340 [Desulfomonilia bacterium]|nr:hypothetical protein [Desulfomonilia bacterium]